MRNGFFSQLWILALGVAFQAILAQAQPPQDPIALFSNQVCNQSPGENLSPPKEAGEVELVKLKSVLTQFHPASREAYEAAVTVAQSMPTPSVTELGPEAKWSAVALQTSELQNQAFGSSQCTAPIARFDKGMAHLSFIATSHVSQAPSIRDQVFGAIKTEFESQLPGAVVVEGYPEDFPCSEAVRIFLTPVEGLTSESEYLVKLALGRGISVSGGEPSETGLAKEDEERFLLLRNMTTFRGQRGSAAEIYAKTQSRFQFGNTVSFEDFQSWYKKTNGREFSLENAFNDITPSYNLQSIETPRGTNRLSDRVDLHRDSQVLKVIRKNLLNRGKVLVTYGRDHFPRQLPVLKAVFGSSGNGTPIAKCAKSTSAQGPCSGS